MDSVQEQLKAISKKREQVVKEVLADPYIGFKNFEEAFSAARITSQPEVFARLLNRENVFISGLAGAGKTSVLKRFASFIDAVYDGKFNIVLTASTAIAATDIDGVTLHSWAGLGISTEPFDKTKISNAMKHRRKAIRETDVLIIDEISMIPAHIITKLDALLKHMRRNNEPFGGIQLITTGDFLQLPPVVNKNTDEDIDNRFAIESEAWKNANFSYCFLDKTYRATDERLKSVLLSIAQGKVSDKTRSLVQSRMNIDTKQEGKVYTQLFTTNKNVDLFNQETLKANSNHPMFYRMRVDGSKENIELIQKQYMIPEVLELKVGATVMCTRNLTVNNTKIANGSIGKVIQLGHNTVRVRFNNGITVTMMEYEYPHKDTQEYKNPTTGKMEKYQVVTARIYQIPLKLGYAITVHKSQGQTFDGVVVDLKNAFQEGLGYVALSRVRDLDDLIITGISEKAYHVSKKSQRISFFVQKSAYRDRLRFQESLHLYEDILVNAIARDIMWNVDETATQQNQRSNTGKITMR